MAITNTEAYNGSDNSNYIILCLNLILQLNNTRLIFAFYQK